MLATDHHVGNIAAAIRALVEGVGDAPSMLAVAMQNEKPDVQAAFTVAAQAFADGVPAKVPQP